MTLKIKKKNFIINTITIVSILLYPYIFCTSVAFAIESKYSLEEIQNAAENFEFDLSIKDPKLKEFIKKYSSKEALPFLIKALKTDNHSIKYLVLSIFKNIDEKDFIFDELTKLIDKEFDPIIIGESALILKQHNFNQEVQKGVNKLIKIVKDVNRTNAQREAAIEMLINFNENKIIPVTIEYLKDQKKKKYYSIASIEVLSKIGNKKSLPILFELLEGNSPKYIKQMVLNVLLKIAKEKKDAQLIDDINSYLVKVINNKSIDKYFRQDAILFLSNLDNKYIYKTLANCLSDDEWSIRNAAICRLGDLSNNDAIGILENQLKVETSGVNIKYIKQILRGKNSGKKFDRKTTE